MNRRRFILAAAASAVAPVAAYAQSTTPAGCSIGFVNGLLQYSPDCPLLTPPGSGLAIAPPSHLAMPVVDETAATAAADEAQTAETERLQNKRDKKDDKHNRRRDQQRQGRERGKDRQDRKREHRRERKDAVKAAAQIDGCEDFDSFAEAQAFYDSVGYDRVDDPLDLDRDRNDVACDEDAPDPTPD